VTTETVLVQYVIYRNPRDWPNGYVTRRWNINRGATEPEPGMGCLCATLEEARESVPEGHYNLGRKPEDEPQIVEVWT
jgi:hypothetical protein